MKIMKCRRKIKCYLNIIVALLFVPQTKVLAQQVSSPGCQAQLNQPFAVINNIPTIQGPEIVDGDLQQVNTEEELLSGRPPYKQSAVRNIDNYWQMRVESNDVSSLSGKKVKYRVEPDNQVGNPFRNVNAIPIGDIKEYLTCSDGTVIVGGGLSLDFRELSMLLGGNYGAQIGICIPLKTPCDAF